MQIFHNAVVYTGDDFTDAFAVEDGRFVAVGADAMALQGEHIDLKGAFVCAGFNDSHMHLLNYGQALHMAPLGLHTGSLAEMLRCLKNAAPDRGWIIGRGWNQDRFSDVRRMPNRHDLDTVSTELPVCAVRACGHALAVNSKAMEVLGITAVTPSPDGGEIDFVRERAGDELAATSYSWKTLLDTGATVSNGSDCPVEDPDVLAGIQCAVTRQDLHSCAPYLPQEAFTIKEALDSFTQAGAFASFEERTKGRIAPGHFADFVVLGADPFQTAPAQIKDIPILQTWLEGERVW